MRTEFGHSRTSCACADCVMNCTFMPGCLIPSDLERMIPAHADPFKWAEKHLLASQGAVVMIAGKIHRIPTLVPAVKSDGSCINLTTEGACSIHEISPFGCAFFDCKTDPKGLMVDALRAIAESWNERKLYFQLWVHLAYKGREAERPEVLRGRIREFLLAKEVST